MKKGTAWAAALFLAPALLCASRLPIKTYTTADGLARDFILCIDQDSRGFLWFCTAEGLSRFDGYQFTSYHAEQGLPADQINDFLESRRGEYYVATAGGLVRLDPAASGPSRFERVPLGGDAAAVPAQLYEDATGAVWCGMSSGSKPLYRRGPKERDFRAVDLPMTDPKVTAILVDRRGTVWLGSPDGLYRRDPDGRTKRYAEADGLPNTFVMALLEDRAGRIWVGTRIGLVRLDEVAADAHARLHTRVYLKADGLPADRIESLLEASDRTLWVGTSEGLAEWAPGNPSAGREFRSYTLAQGLAARGIGALAEDRDGNVWIGTFGSGVMKVARRGFTTYTEADGLPPARMLLETRQGELCAVHGGGDGSLSVDRFDGRRFEPFQPAWPGRISYFGWGHGQIAVEDPSGEWWIATGRGLCRFPPVRRLDELAALRPKAVYGTRDGLASENIFRVFQDSRGDVWIGTIGPGSEDGLALYSRATGRVRAFSEADGLPPHPVPTALAEDRDGAVWVGLFHGGLARHRGGRFAFFGPEEGVPGVVHSLYLDSGGRLWVATSLGLLRLEDPTGERPAFVRYTAANGLSSSDIEAITEDRWGRIYAATGRGIDRFEPLPEGPGRIQHYTTADGVAPGQLLLAMRDRQGTLWFATPLGLSHFVPEVDRPRQTPPVRITGLSVGGVARPISDLGEPEVSGLRFTSRPLRIDYLGLGYSPGEALRYQYTLEGADSDWNAPTDQRAVVYASLSPGRYRFRVRAVLSEGMASQEPASVAFTVLPPLWRNPWFLAAFAAMAVAAGYALHRYRLQQVLAVAHLRTRIATDLHDDIGASLSQIAILSEVARKPGALAPDPQGEGPLSEIAGISRELVGSMGDIVWAINPEQDRLSNLVHRIRRFATDLLGSHDVRLKFESSLAEGDARLDANVRRQVYLIFKEAIHNVARHSGATAVDVALDDLGETLRLTVRDDGRGFDPEAEHEGHGLTSMRKRAAALGARLDLESAPGRGAALTLWVPRRRARALSTLRGKIGRLFR